MAIAMSKPRGKRHIESTPIQAVLRADTRRRDAPSRRRKVQRVETHAPGPPWDIGTNPSMRTSEAVDQARHVFGDRPREVDAVLGWLFTRFSSFGALGDDMVAHHALLMFDSYYSRWVEFCGALSLFPRDP